MGAGQTMIARLLGHANTGATERYTQFRTDATAALVEARWARLTWDQAPSSRVLLPGAG
jgi:site-specific recombinase XerD